MTSSSVAHVSRDLSTEEAFRAIARACLAQLLANEAAMLAGNGEALHQMRVALRRLRAAMSVFAAVVGDAHLRRIRRELRWIGAALGPARDLDVFITQVLTPLRQQHAAEPGVRAICRDFAKRREIAYAEAAAAVRSQRFHSLVSNTRAWVEAGPWTTHDGAQARLRREQPIATHAADELARRRRKLRRRGKTVRQLTVAERHRLRIRAKKIRYAIEFFADLYTRRKQAKRCKAALAALEELQDALGALNDIATHEALASHMATAIPRRSRGAAAKAFAAGVIFGAEEAHVNDLLASADRAYRAFLDVKPFWS